MKLQKAEQTDFPVIQKFYWDVFENRSRLLSCLVYHGSACFTGFPGHQCAPGGARFQRVQVPNSPGSGKDIAEGKGVHREVESEGSWM